jgi:hypothetical protein
MRKTRTAKTVLCAAVLVASCMAMAAEDEGPSLSTSVSAAFMSKYIWRGQLLNDDYVMQPSVGVSYGGLSASLWGSLDMTEYHKDASGNDNQWEFTEYDWTIGYAEKVPGIDFLKYSVGAIYYYFPSLTDDGDTLEVYAGLGLDMMFSPTVTLYRDIDEIDGTYIAFSVGHSVEKIFEFSSDMPVAMNLSASVGWGSAGYNKGYWFNDDEPTKSVTSSSMQDLTLTAGFPFDVMGWTVTPSVSYVTLVSSKVRDADTYATYSGNDDSDYVFTGFTLSKSF